MTKEIIENDPYKTAGVDIDAGNDLVEKIKKDVASSHNKNVLGNIGGFAGMYELGKNYDEPVLVACTDGVGTKVALAQEFNQVDGIGQDLVAMCVNDLIVCGAKPLFFLDYFASSKLEVEEASKIIKNISEACKNSGCALLGGETAEMPGHYVGKNFDLAGFSVGCVEKEKIINGKNIKEGERLGIRGPFGKAFDLKDHKNIMLCFQFSNIVKLILSCIYNKKQFTEVFSKTSILNCYICYLRRNGKILIYIKRNINTFYIITYRVECTSVCRQQSSCDLAYPRYNDRSCPVDHNHFWPLSLFCVLGCYVNDMAQSADHDSALLHVVVAVCLGRGGAGRGAMSQQALVPPSTQSQHTTTLHT